MKIKIENIKKIYKQKEKDIIALNNINLEFNENKFYAIMGHSGSGKSTLLNIMGLLEKQTEGKVYIDNIDVESLSEKEKSGIKADKIGFVFQSYYLNPRLKVYENILLPLYLNKKVKTAERKEVIKKLLDEVGLLDKIKRYPKDLSGGEQQRVAIARALANNPEIILADEPTGNLDSQNEENIFEILKKLSENGKLVIVATHSKEVEKYADEIIKIEEGKIV